MRQADRQTDKQNDGQTDRQTIFSVTVEGQIPAKPNLANPTKVNLRSGQPRGWQGLRHKGGSAVCWHANPGAPSSASKARTAYMVLRFVMIIALVNLDYTMTSRN